MQSLPNRDDDEDEEDQELHKSPYSTSNSTANSTNKVEVQRDQFLLNASSHQQSNRPIDESSHRICSKHKCIYLDFMEDEDSTSSGSTSSSDCSDSICIKCCFEQSRQCYLSRIACSRLSEQQKQQTQPQQSLQQRRRSRNQLNYPNDISSSDLVLIQDNLLAVRHGGDTLDIIDFKKETCISSHKSPSIFRSTIQLCSMSLSHKPSPFLILLSRINENNIDNSPTNFGYASIYDYRHKRIDSRIPFHITLVKQLTYNISIIVHIEKSNADLPIFDGLQDSIQRISLYSCLKQREIRRFPQRFRGICAVDISSDRERIACGSGETKLILILSTHSGDVLQRLVIDSFVTKLFFEPNSVNLLFETKEFALCYYDHTHQKISKTRNVKLFEFMPACDSEKQVFCKKLYNAPRSMRNPALAIFDIARLKLRNFGSEALNPIPKAIHTVLSFQQHKLIFIAKNSILFYHQLNE